MILTGCCQLPQHAHQMIQCRLYILLALLFAEASAQQRFVMEPQHTSAIQGSTTILKCTVANRIGSLQWTQNRFALGADRNLPGFPRYSMVGSESVIGSETRGEFNLKIIDIQLVDDANYQCQVGAAPNVQGIRSQTAKLDVLLPPEQPTIDETPIIAVVLGRPSNISCRANNGKPAADISWYMNDERLSDWIYSRSVPRPDGKRVDTIGIVTVNATKADGGKRIECQALNRAMVVPFRTSATLNVQYTPEISMGINISRTLREYDFIRFSCSGMANPTQVTWRWYRNDQMIKNENRDYLDIPSISREYHQDTISCEGTNAVGSTKKDYKLNVEFGPRFISTPGHIAVDLGQEAILRCQAEGNPKASIIWTKKGSHHVQGSSPTLRIPKVHEGSFGVYVCTATVMGFNEVSREIYLLQNGPPKVMSESQQYASKGDTARVECLAMSVPKPKDIVWTREGKDINFAAATRFSANEEDLPYGRKSILRIKEVHEEDFGVYNCSVVNDYGKDVAVISLIEKAVPPLPYIIGGAVGGVAVLFIIVLACVLYHRYKSADSGSVLGSYTDTDSSTDKKREKSDSPSTLMDQWRQDYNKDFYRYSADYDELNYGGKDPKGNNNAYGFIEPYPLEAGYREAGHLFTGEYAERTDEVGPAERYETTYNGQFPLSSFRGGDYTDASSRLPPASLSSSKLATNV